MSQGVPDQTTLRVEIKNERLLDLADLAQSFEGFASQFHRYLTVSGTPDAEVRLVVREIKGGSVIADLFAMAGLGVPLFWQQGYVSIEQASTLIGYAKRLKECFDYFLKKGERPALLNAKDCREVSQIVNPIAKDGAAQLNISVLDGSTLNLFVATLGSTEAAAVKLRATEEIVALKEPTQTRYEKVLMYWHQASRDAKGRADRAVIESIHEKPLKVIFADDSIKQQMISGEDNPFLVGFVVDVEVLTVDHAPVAYKVTALHEAISDDGGPGSQPGSNGTLV